MLKAARDASVGPGDAEFQDMERRKGEVVHKELETYRTQERAGTTNRMST